MAIQVILLKTYLWSSELEEYALKLLTEITDCNSDFFILLHDEKREVRQKIMSNELQIRTLSFTSDDIKKIYETDYFDIYFRSHLIHFWFFKNHSHYDYYWILEYDTRIAGNSRIFWNYLGQENFISPTGVFDYPKDSNFYTHYENNKKNIKRLTEHSENLFWTYIQFIRCSNNFLEYMDNKLTEGENGQDECITGTMVISGNFNYTILDKYIKGTWHGSSPQDLIEYNRNEWLKYKELYKDSEKEVAIFHPVK